MAEISEILRSARQAALSNRFDTAAGLCRRVLATYPNCLIALRILAWTELEGGQDTARDRFGTCSLLDPEDPLASVGQGVLHELQGRSDRALEHFVRAYELDPSDDRIAAEIVRLGGTAPQTHLAEAMRRLAKGDNAGAADHLRAASASNQSDPASCLALARAIWPLGGRTQVNNLVITVLGLSPNCLKAILYQLAVEVDGRRMLRARELVGRAAEIDPGFLLSRQYLGELGGPFLADTALSLPVRLRPA
ncbi:MAG: hypothetical protein HY329_03470 [Chloroflexi bacterium]|nr:hypothetical protein [Chloroflexota bacterium]